MKIHYTAVVFHRVLRGPSVEKNIVDLLCWRNNVNHVLDGIL